MGKLPEIQQLHAKIYGNIDFKQTLIFLAFMPDE